MATGHLAKPEPPPELNIPSKETTVKVSCIDAKCRLKLPMGPFLQPNYVGKDYLTGPCLSFLIEHPSRKPILFDIGIRKDFEKLPVYPKMAEKKWGISVESDVATILTEQGVDLKQIESIIWSHHHWDHTGDASTFPSSTGLVVGPGFKAAHLPGYPKNKDSTLLETDVEGRELREINDFRDDFKIGRFKAHDYFGDGSFYLLDTPGHSIGHICGLARTSSDPDSFIFMGGDASHHGGEFRPTRYLPLPREVDASTLKSAKRSGGVCPGELLQHAHYEDSATKPFYNVTESFAHDKPTADWTIEGMGEFDAHENIFVLVAHDNDVLDPPQFDLYPKSMNSWYADGSAQKVKWRFLADFEEAAKAKEQGQKPFTWADS